MASGPRHYREGVIAGLIGASPKEIVFTCTVKPIAPPCENRPPAEPVTRILFTYRVP